MSNVIIPDFKDANEPNLSRLWRKVRAHSKSNKDGVVNYYFAFGSERYCLLCTHINVSMVETTNDVLMLTANSQLVDLSWGSFHNFSSDLELLMETIGNGNWYSENIRDYQFFNPISGNTWLSGNAENVVPYLLDYEVL